MKPTAKTMSSLELATLSDRAFLFGERLSAPSWVIAAVGIAIGFAGIGYFVAQARRRGLGPRR